MSKPQQPELDRSKHTPADQDHAEEMARDAKRPQDDPARGRIPPDNRPGNRPDKVQDKPEALGGAGHGTGSGKKRR